MTRERKPPPPAPQDLQRGGCALGGFGCLIIIVTVPIMAVFGWAWQAVGG